MTHRPRVCAGTWRPSQTPTCLHRSARRLCGKCCCFLPCRLTLAGLLASSPSTVALSKLPHRASTHIHSAHFLASSSPARSQEEDSRSLRLDSVDAPHTKPSRRDDSRTIADALVVSHVRIPALPFVLRTNHPRGIPAPNTTSVRPNDCVK